ncbi:MAG: helix-turn-helix transcriptional regulator [Bacilli bacterium]|nr:helix-turn-helix transcriptional regulator [Bacilli bacterium]
MDYGIRLYELRKQKALSQEEVANKIGVSRQSISLWETNQASPSMDNLVAIAKLFNTSLDVLVGMKNLNEISELNEEVPLITIDYEEDKHVVYRRDYIYLNSKADTIMFFLSLFFLIFALISFISALNMEIQTAKIALIIGFVSIIFGLTIYPFYIYINILKKTENHHSIHIELHDEYIIYDCSYCNKKKIPYKMIDYYIEKKDYMLLFAFKRSRIYIPSVGDNSISKLCSVRMEKRKTKRLF